MSGNSGEGDFDDPAFKEVAASGATQVYASNLTGWTLAALDRKAGVLTVAPLEDDASLAGALDRTPPNKRAAFVLINANETVPQFGIDIRQSGPLLVGERLYERRVSEDGKFLLYLATR